MTVSSTAVAQTGIGQAGDLRHRLRWRVRREDDARRPLRHARGDLLALFVRCPRLVAGRRGCLKGSVRLSATAVAISRRFKLMMGIGRDSSRKSEIGTGGTVFRASGSALSFSATP